MRIAVKQVYSAVSLAAVAIIWEVGTRLLHIPVYLVPSLSLIFSRALSSPVPWGHHALVTLYEVLSGFLIASAVGMAIGVVITYSKVLENVLYPILLIAQVVPKVALAPLFLVWLGFGPLPKVVLTFLIAVFPIVINTAIGLKIIPRDMLDLVRSLKSGAWREFRLVRFPNALPYVFGGLEIGITLAVVGAIVAEFAGADEGLGYLVLAEGSQFQTPLVFFSLFLVSAVGIILYGAVVLLERIVIPWHTREQKIIAGG